MVHRNGLPNRGRYDEISELPSEFLTYNLFTRTHTCDALPCPLSLFVKKILPIIFPVWQLPNVTRKRVACTTVVSGNCIFWQLVEVVTNWYSTRRKLFHWTTPCPNKTCLTMMMLAGWNLKWCRMWKKVLLLWTRRTSSSLYEDQVG